MYADQSTTRTALITALRQVAARLVWLVHTRFDLENSAPLDLSIELAPEYNGAVEAIRKEMNERIKLT